MKTWSDYYSRLDIGDFLRRFPFPSQTSSLVARYAQRGDRILEAGMGTAVDSIYLSHYEYQIFGIDKELQIVKNARELNESLKGKAKFIQMDTFKLGFKDNSFDLIFHEGTIEHYNNKEIIEMLKEQLRVAKIVILGVPTSRYPRSAPGTYPGGSFGDENFLTFRQLKEVLVDFKIIEINGCGVVEPKYKRLLINMVYLPFWIINEKIWSRRYLPFCNFLYFIITNR